MELLKVTDVYGRTCFVSRADWDRGRTQTSCRFKTGRTYLDAPKGLCPKGGASIHRANVARVEASHTVED